MTKDELFELVKRVDPQAVRVPPGIAAIADAIEEKLRAALVDRVPLTRCEIEAALVEAIEAKKLSWLGFKEDSSGFFTVPVLSECHYQIAAAIEAAHGIKES